MTELVSGEAVVLDIPCAQYPSRMGALLLDMLIQLVGLAILLIIIFAAVHSTDPAVLAGVFVSCYVLVTVGYPVVFETLSRGQTVGKMAMGLRVVSDDGGPIRFRQALVRGLTGAIEIWSLIGAPVGLMLSIMSPRGKRLGDMFAGTYVIQERLPHRPALGPAFAAVPPPLAGWAQVAETAGLSDQTAEAASSYLRRFYQLSDRARADLGVQLAQAVATQVSPPPPPGTPPAAYLSAVLAVRRHQSAARLAAQHRFVAEAQRDPSPWGTSPGPPGAAPPSPWAMPGTQTAAVPPGPPAYPAAPSQPPAFPYAPAPYAAAPYAPAPYAAAPYAQGPPAQPGSAGVPPAHAWTASGEPEPVSPDYGFAPPG